MARESKIIIAKNIKIDKEYKEVLNYTEQQMLTLVETNAVASALDYSFIRDKGTISTNFTYNQALQCNYMAFQNKDYSNKWFFAWIEDVRYVNDGTTEISYTIDAWSTWFEKLTVGQSFVIREHVNDDTAGLHTLPEDVETGEYISTKLQPTNKYFLETCYCVATTKKWFSSYTIQNQDLPTGTYYQAFDSIQGVEDFINHIDTQSGANSVVTVFVCPKDFFSNWGPAGGITIAGNVSTSVLYNLPSETIEVTHVDYLGNEYVPKNNKLKCYPYSFLQVSNHSGIVVNYKWEDFNLLSAIADGKYKFRLGCTLTPGCSGYVYPINYKNIIDNYDEGIPFGKFPIGGWNTDVYTNWLTQNGINIALNTATGILSTATGAITGNPIGVASGGISIANSIASIYQHSLEPPQAKGNVNVGDFNFSNAWLSMEFKRISVKDEYARIIDDYFTRYGYKINRLKVPNITGRTYWNYIQIASEDNLGSGEIPQKFMDEINRIARQGTTIWHNHTNIGNYSLNNTIV